MTTIYVAGAAGPLSAALCAKALADPNVTKVVALRPPSEDASGDLGVPGVDVRAVDLRRHDLAFHLEPGSTIVHLAAGVGMQLDGTGVPGVDVFGTRRLLAAATSVGVTHFVALSSATVYGPWENNPVPLTEDAALRPHADLDFAVRKAELERLVWEWCAENPGVTAAVLRPTMTVSADSADWMAQSLWSGLGSRAGAAGPAAQFLHHDDLVEAMDLARRERLDGPFNVAPDGWITAEQLLSLAPLPQRWAIPEWLASRIASFRWRVGDTSTPPGVVPYTRGSWVVANDRLKAAGWVPEWTNEEAYVVGHRAPPLSMLNAKRRQELALGAMAVVGVGAGVGIGLGVRAALRRRSVDS